MFIPSGADQEVIARLDWAFSETNINTIRAQHAAENLFHQRHHTLHRVAWRINAVPQGNTKAAGDLRLKWYAFLSRVLKDPAKDAIKTALRSALADNNCIAVKFHATLGDPNVDHFVYLDPNNNNPWSIIHPDPV